MKLITVEVEFRPDAVQTALATIEAQAKSVRGMQGCNAYAHYRSSDMIAIVQKWQTEEDFNAYRASAAFSELGASLKPLMAAAPVTTVAQVDSQ